MSQYLGFQPTKNPNYYFVSYNNEDADRVGAITKQIAASGVDLWYDHGIDYGSDWETVITERIHHAQAIVLFFSKGILRKKDSYVQKEYKIATRFFHKKVYVVLMDQISLDEIPDEKAAWWMEINEKQCITGYEYEDNSVLVQDIIGALHGEGRKGSVPVATGNTKPPQKPRRFGCGIAILAALLALFLIAGVVSGAFVLSPSFRENFPFLEELYNELFSETGGSTPADTDEPVSDDQTTDIGESTTDNGEQDSEEQTEPHVHAFGDWTTLVQPTCTETGKAEHTCECGETEQQTVSALGHTEVVDEAVSPTCTETGLTAGKHCSVCDKVFEAQQTVDATGHSFGEWHETIAPTETQKGEKRRDCKNCDEYETAPISAVDPDTDCNHIPGEVEQEDYEEPDCLYDGGYDEVVYCTVCDEELERTHVVLEASGYHVPGEAVEEEYEEPDCYNDGGYDEVIYCTVCDEELERTHVVLEASGYHTPGEVEQENYEEPDCLFDGGYDEVIYCTDCY